MNLIDKLKSISTNRESLEKYLKDNFVLVYDFFSSQRYVDLIKYRKQFRLFISNHHTVFRELDLTDKSNLSFLILLLQYSEMLGLLSEFKILHNILSKYSTFYGNRIQAASLYCLHQRNTTELIDIYDDLLKKLSIAYIEEEDNEDNVISTFINYYAQIVNNSGQFNQSFVIAIRDKIRDSVNKDEYYFLKNNAIDDILKVNITQFDQAYSEIKSILDDFLKRKHKKFVYQDARFLIEEGTKYEKLLQNVNQDFESIRQISVKKFMTLPNSDSIFYSILHGVKVLTKENQLFAYMNSLGKMHYAKLNSAFEYLPQNFFDKEINIIDWACGQGLATITYLDFLQKNKYMNNLSSITLIEPSEIALNRATLHSKKMDDRLSIITIHKDLDALVREDFANSNSKITLQIFSNILDVNSFSMNKLFILLKQTMVGINYFICVSPSISVQKNARIDSFVNAFSKEGTFKMIKSISNRKGEWCNNWSRILRVFKVEF